MRISLLLLLSFLTTSLFSQDTFSIVAVDMLTGEVGSAGATCLDADDIAGGALIISDVIPDHGAIHTQSFWIPTNQTAAHNEFVGGLSPEELMTWLEENDAQGDPTIRQYGAVDLITGEPRAAAFTGDACFDYHSHIVGINYAIQGNILLDETILPAMEDGFVNTNGTLAEKLMAALQGANVPGADSRCLDEGVSSKSAFLRVACPGDDAFDLCLDLLVDITPFGHEPIDSLQNLFDQTLNVGEFDTNGSFSVYPNPAKDMFQLVIPQKHLGKVLTVNMYSQSGRLVYSTTTQNLQALPLSVTSPGMYYVVIQEQNSTVFRHKLVALD